MAKTITQLPDASSVADGDELIVQQSGVTKRATKLEVIAGIKNASIASDAAIAYSKLAALTAGNVIIGNASNVPTSTTVTGDVTISNAGVTEIAAGAITPAKLSRPYTLATAQASTSGTSIDFTGIPSWARRITVMFQGVSTGGTSRKQVQLGTSAGFVTSGYSGGFGTTATSTVAGSSSTTGIPLGASNLAADSISGMMVIALCNTNAWVSSFVGGSPSGNNMNYSGGSITLSGTLDRIRVTTENGTDAFDAGTINIAYEG